MLTHGPHRNERLGVTLSTPSVANSPLLLPPHPTGVPQLKLPFVLEARKEPVVCVIRFIYYGSVPGGVTVIILNKLKKKTSCLHVKCRSSGRLMMAVVAKHFVRLQASWLSVTFDL